MSDWLVDDSLTPDTTGPLAPLFEAAADGRLALPFCGRCVLPLELDQFRCDGCGSTDVAWHTVEPTGVIHTTTTVHRREPGLILTDGPYHLVDVQLEGGHRLLMTTVTATGAAPAIGDAAQIAFRTVGGVAIPALVPPPTGGTP